MNSKAQSPIAMIGLCVIHCGTIATNCDRYDLIDGEKRRDGKHADKGSRAKMKPQFQSSTILSFVF